jgi:hypothetical protein
MMSNISLLYRGRVIGDHIRVRPGMSFDFEFSRSAEDVFVRIEA